MVEHFIVYILLGVITVMGWVIYEKEKMPVYHYIIGVLLWPLLAIHGMFTILGRKI